MLIVDFIFIWWIASLVHVSALAVSAKLAGVAIQEIRYGLGPILLSFGRYRFSILPLGGFVKMKDSREEQSTSEATHDAYDCQPRWKQALMPLGGPAALMLLTLLLLGTEGWRAFLDGFSQVFAGALAPLSEAQTLLKSFDDFLHTRPFLATLGLFSAKMAAVNLLPLPMLNGGAAILALLGFNRARERTTTAVQMVGLLVFGALWLSWIVALAVYLLR